MFNLFRKPQAVAAPERSERAVINDAIADAESSLRSISERIVSVNGKQNRLTEELTPLKIRQSELDEAMEYALAATTANPDDVRMANLLKMADEELAENIRSQQDLKEELSRANEELAKIRPLAVELKNALESLHSQVKVLDSRNESATAINRLESVRNSIRSYEHEVAVNEAFTELRSPV